MLSKLNLQVGDQFPLPILNFLPLRNSYFFSGTRCVGNIVYTFIDKFEEVKNSAELEQFDENQVVFIQEHYWGEIEIIKNNNKWYITNITKF